MSMNRSIMRMGERGQIVVPKHLRERFGLLPKTEVEVVELRGVLTIRRAPKQTGTRKDAWDKVRGMLKNIDIDKDIEEMRGR